MNFFEKLDFQIFFFNFRRKKNLTKFFWKNIFTTPKVLLSNDLTPKMEITWRFETSNHRGFLHGGQGVQLPPPPLLPIFA